MTQESKMKVETTKYIQMSVQHKQYRYIFKKYRLENEFKLEFNKLMDFRCVQLCAETKF